MRCPGPAEHLYAEGKGTRHSMAFPNSSGDGLDCVCSLAAMPFLDPKRFFCKPFPFLVQRIYLNFYVP